MMEILITETGEIEELTLTDPKSGVDWINDLMGNCNALPACNDEGQYLMTQEDFEWWADLVIQYQSADDRYHKLLHELHGEKYDALLDDAQDIAVDLEDYPGALRMVCDEYDKGEY